MKEETGVHATSNQVRLGKISKCHFKTNYLVVSQNIIDCGPNNGQSTGGMSVNILNIDNFVALVQCIKLFIPKGKSITSLSYYIDQQHLPNRFQNNLCGISD